uniref:Uncharacterized protein n=1 Tax=Rhabditophanes sp. KR3021 TaxID=114890 RepID=A0AC35UGS7_9BILA
MQNNLDSSKASSHMDIIKTYLSLTNSLANVPVSTPFNQPQQLPALSPEMLLSFLQSQILGGMNQGTTQNFIQPPSFNHLFMLNDARTSGGNDVSGLLNNFVTTTPAPTPINLQTLSLSGEVNGMFGQGSSNLLLNKLNAFNGNNYGMEGAMNSPLMSTPSALMDLKLSSFPLPASVSPPIDNINEVRERQRKRSHIFKVQDEESGSAKVFIKPKSATNSGRSSVEVGIRRRAFSDMPQQKKIGSKANSKCPLRHHPQNLIPSDSRTRVIEGAGALFMLYGHGGSLLSLENLSRHWNETEEKGSVGAKIEDSGYSSADSLSQEIEVVQVKENKAEQLDQEMDVISVSPSISETDSSVSSIPEKLGSISPDPKKTLETMIVDILTNMLPSES